MTSKISEALKNVQEFIKSLKDAGKMPDISDRGIFFSGVDESGEDEGMLILNLDETNRYLKCLKMLVEAIDESKISRRAIETGLQKSILATLDIQEKRKKVSFEDRLKKAIEDLKTYLTSSPESFKVFYPVKNLDINGLPIQIGDVQFLVYEEEIVERQFEIYEEMQTGYGPKADDKATILLYKKFQPVGVPFAMVEVEAVEAEAARAAAVNKLSQTIDILNFFTDLGPSTIGYMFLPGEGERINAKYVVFGTQNFKSSFGSSVVGPFAPFNFATLFDIEAKHNLGYNKVKSLVIKKRNKLEEILLSAIQWCGRATIAKSKEMAFLFYAISLETLIIPEGNNAELNYRLRLRVAHLLGDTLSNRLTIYNKVRDLYKIRSNIVHDGRFEVTDSDLYTIRLYSKACILELLKNEKFSGMNKDDLVDWFNDQLLQSAN